MSSDDDFLSRWSRRKQAAADPEKALSDVQKPEDQPVGKNAAVRTDNEEEVFDVTKLPPIDSITAISDVRDFLRAGVPADLTRAALRRAWSADPAIRDFIGLAENAWDFNDPNAMPGFGPLAATDNVRQMVEQIMSRIGDATASPTDEGLRKTPQAAGSAIDSASANTTPPQSSASSARAALPSAEKSDDSGVGPQVDVAMHQQADEKSRGRGEEQKILRRTHGSAIPH